jgi:hypothetical protein
MGLWRLSDFDASRSMSMHPSLRVIIDPQVLIADVPKFAASFRLVVCDETLVSRETNANCR